MNIQETQDETFRQHKNYFQHFLDSEDNYGNYSEKIRMMMNEGSERLVVDLNDLRAYDSSFSDATSTSDNIVNRIMRHPMEHIPPFEEAVKDLVLNYDSTYGSKETKQTQFHIGFEGDLGSNEVSPRGLMARLLCQLVCVGGVVTKCSVVRPKVVKSVHYCPATNQMISREYRDATSLTGLPTSSVYPTKDQNGNLLETEFGLCKYKDYQVVTIQEAPETAPLGQLPRSIDVIMENDLVDKCKPGDRVRAIGVYRALAGKTSASTSGVYRTVVISNNIQILGKEIQGIVMTTDDLLHVRELAKRDDIFNILGRSIAPSIFGHEYIKQALLLQLLGGVEKNLENGTHLRGDINILMVGDPSTAKSQLLRFVRGIAPLAVNTTGRGSSGVGLTAAVTKDAETNEKRLEAGAMVLADRGIVCIDEFDKMSEADRVAIHEVMEQQTVTIAKAGIHATLNARCSVLAAANPVYGQYNKDRKPQDNIGLPDSLLSRFDLLFVVLDKLDRDPDRKISDHVLRMHRFCRPGQEGVPLSLDISSLSNHESQDSSDRHEPTSVWQAYNPVLHGDKKFRKEILSMEFLKKYIYYAKTRYNPSLSDAAIDTISQGYAELRSQQDARTLPVTVRSLETSIRLATAHAKARLSNTINRVDAEKAMELMRFALYHDTNDDEASKMFEQEVETQPESEDDEEQVPEEIEPIEETRDSESPSKRTSDEMEKDSSKRSRTEDQPIRVEDAVTLALMKLSDEDEDDSGIPVVRILQEVNENGGQKDKLTKRKLTSILKRLEEENRLMFIRDEDKVIRV